MSSSDTPSAEHYTFWHGAQKWEGRPSLRPSRAKRHEDGPGLYMTNSLDRAKSYARGAGCLVEMTLSGETRWLDDVRLPLSELQAFVTQTSGLRKKAQLMEDLERAGRREGEQVHASTLVNLCVNHDALQGHHGPLLAQWLTDHGVDASHTMHGGESWVVVFNPAKIIKTQVHRVATVNPHASFPGWAEQTARIQSQSPAPAALPEEAATPPRRRRSP